MESRVFRTIFDLRIAKQLCRCDCAQRLRMTSSARIAILVLVLGISLHRKRHLEFVSNDSGSALSEE